MSKPFLFPRKQLSAVIVSLLTPNLVSAAQVDWVGTTGFWDVASNWGSSPVLPTSVDDAVLNVAGSQTITVRSSSSVNSINTNSGDEALALTGGTLNLLGAVTGSNANGTSSINAFTQTAGTLGGAGNLSISGAAALNGGSQTGTGTTLLKGASSIGGAIGLDSGRILRNEGSLTWTSGNIDLNAGPSGGAGRIDNAAGGVWEAQGSNTIFATGYSDLNSVSGFPAFNNAGTFRKSGANTTTTIGVAFNNNGGSVDVQSGALNLTAGGSHQGTNQLTAGVMNFVGGTHSLQSGASFAGNGELRLSAGTLRSDSNDATIASHFNQTGGTISGTGSVSISGAAALNGGSQTGTGTTLLKGASSIGGNIGLDSGRILRNEGSLTWAPGSVNLNATGSGGAGRIDNAAGGVWEAQGSNSIVASNFGDLNSASGFPAFNNAGTFRKSGANTTTTIDVAFNNNGGSVDVQSGALNLTAGGSHQGTNQLTAGVMNFAGGTHSLQSGASFAGNGELRLSAGTLHSDSNDATIASHFNQTGGTISGTGSVSISGAAALNGGSQTGTGTTLLKGASSIGGNIGLDSGRILRNEGSLTWAPGSVNLNATGSGGAGRIDNAAGGVWEAQGSNSIVASNFGDLNSASDFPAFNNAGTFRKNGATTTTNINVAFDNNGTVDVNSGKVQLTGAASANGFINQGSVLVAADSIFETNSSSSRDFDNQGTLGGNGQINVNGSNNRLLNNGEILPGGDNAIGKLTIDFNSSGSSFQQLALGEMQFDLTSLHSYDQLHIADAGSIALSGTLQINSLGACRTITLAA